MRKISLSEAIRYRIGPFTFISSVNPHTKRATVQRGSSTSFYTWEHLKQAYGIEISPTPEELVMIERGRLSPQSSELVR